MVKIPLTKGKFALVDNEDSLAVCFLGSWYFSSHGYAMHNYRINYITHVVGMHRFIAERMGLDMNVEIDHRDRDKLNNCRNNLRTATEAQQTWNSRKYNNTGYIGVSYDKVGKSFMVNLIVDKIKVLSQSCKTVEEAAKLRDLYAKHYQGDFAVLNFPEK